MAKVNNLVYGLWILFLLIYGSNDVYMCQLFVTSFGGREYMHVRTEMHGRFSGPIHDH